MRYSTTFVSTEECCLPQDPERERDCDVKILYVLPTVPHPTMRGELRHYYFLRALAERHAISLLGLAKTPVSVDAYEELRAWTERLVIVEASTESSGGFLGRAAKWRRLRRAVDRMRHAFHELLEQDRFDLVLSYEHDLYPIFAGFKGTPLVLDLCDATSLRLGNRLRFTTAAEWPWRYYRYHQARVWEQRFCALSPHVIFISNRDRSAVAGHPPSSLVIPNGVDTGYWQADTRRRPSGSVVFTGVMDYPPNVDAALYLIRELAPRIQHAVPGAEFVIAGRNPSRAITEAARNAAGVVVTGGVDDLRPYLDRASVFAAPLRFSSGMQNKILEAMAMCVPVVTTPVVADGLRLDNVGDPPVRVATTPDALTTEIVTFLQDPAAHHTFGTAGRRFVERHFNWASSADALDNVCRRAARSPLAAKHSSQNAQADLASPDKEHRGAIDTIA